MNYKKIKQIYEVSMKKFRFLQLKQKDFVEVWGKDKDRKNIKVSGLLDEKRLSVHTTENGIETEYLLLPVSHKELYSFPRVKNYKITETEKEITIKGTFLNNTIHAVFEKEDILLDHDLFDFKIFYGFKKGFDYPSLLLLEIDPRGDEYDD